MARYRLSASAQVDVIEILTHTESHFGDAARQRYEVLLVTALRDIASNPDRPGATARPELGADARTWHLRLSRDRAGIGAGAVHRPRHFIVFRVREPGFVEVGRILHDAMELERHRLTDDEWN
jgi:toxin ParE1/3/4